MDFAGREKQHATAPPAMGGKIDVPFFKPTANFFNERRFA